MELVHEFDYEAKGSGLMMVGAGPFGTRMVGNVSGGPVTGERIKGEIVGAGADWLLVGPDGFGRVDVRLQIQTHDGALIYVSYLGLIELNEAAGRAMVGEATAFDDHYFRTTPRLETGDERYAWVNQTLFVARGRFIENGVAYEVFRVT